MQYKYCQTNTHSSELWWLTLTLIGWQQMIAEGRVGKFNKMFKTQPWALKQLTCVPCHHCHWRFYTVVDEFINPCTNEGGTNLAARTVQQSTGGQRGCMKPHMHNSQPARMNDSVTPCQLHGQGGCCCSPGQGLKGPWFTIMGFGLLLDKVRKSKPWWVSNNENFRTVST